MKDFTGYLHADGYDGYHNLPERITMVGCMAHLRRKFFDVFKVLTKGKQPGSNAAKGVEYCDRLFRIEKNIASLTEEGRTKERERLSRPLFDEFYAWIDGLAALPDSLLGKAVHMQRPSRNIFRDICLTSVLKFQTIVPSAASSRL